MKENEFLDGVSNIEPDVVERFVSMDNKLQKKANKPKSKGIWLRLGAAVACFALVVSAIIVLPMLIGEDAGDIEPPDVPIIFDATVSSERLNGNNLEFIVGSSVGGGDGAPPSFEFSAGGFAVKAKVVKNHPDKYYKLDVSSERRSTAYRLIQMETIEVISGENLSRYFLYLIPDYVYVDMSVYDSLLISMSQLGTENYVLRNGTKNQMESFELPIFADYQDHPELGNIIAFSSDIFDESLWQNYSWLYGYQFARYYLNNPEYSNLVVSRGDSERTVISAIKNKYDEWYGGNYQERSVITLNFTTQAAKDALEYVKPFANGVFSQRYEPYYGNGQLIFTRYINGCQTEETITIDLLTEEVVYSEVRYTKEDIEYIVDISVYLSEKATEYSNQLPIPPHTDPEGKELYGLNLYAWYVKVNGKLYGVIKTVWKYQEFHSDDHAYYSLGYYDDAYVLYDMSAGTAIDISRDDLVKIVGTRNVYMGEYGEGFEIPLC